MRIIRAGIAVMGTVLALAQVGAASSTVARPKPVIAVIERTPTSLSLIADCPSGWTVDPWPLDTYEFDSVAAVLDGTKKIICRHQSFTEYKREIGSKGHQYVFQFYLPPPAKPISHSSR